MLAPLVAVFVWAERKLSIDGRGGMATPSGPKMNCSRRGHRQPGIRLTGLAALVFAISDKTFLQVARTAGMVAGGRAYSTPNRVAKAAISAIPSTRGAEMRSPALAKDHGPQIVRGCIDPD
jgi:hypothetical protein